MKSFTPERHSFITKIILAALLLICVAVPAGAATTRSGDYEYMLITDKNGVTTAKLTDYFGDEAVVVMPSYVDGYRVTEVTNSLYDTQKSTLKKVTWAGTVSEVPYHMFDKYPVLETVILSEGVTTIDYFSNSSYSAFYNCTSLTSVYLPSTLTYIGNYAFYGCSALTSIIIPDSVEYIGFQAFYACTSMTSAIIGNGVTSCGSYIFENCTNLKQVTLKQGITTLGNRMFYGSGLEKLSIPSSVTNFSNSICRGLEESLKHVVLYISVIPYDSFDDFTALETVILGEGVIKIDDGSGGTYSAFSDCTNLTAVSLPSTLTYIGDYTFSGCSALTSITIPDSVKHIGAQAFVSCTSLTSATIGKGVTSWGTSAFLYCTSLTDVTLKPGLTTLGNRIFDHSGVEKLVIPGTITNFSGSTCNGMQKSLKHLEINISTIPANAFDNFTALETLILGEGVTKINSGSHSSYSTFSDCTSLTSVSLPNTLTYIGDYAFSGCSSLTSITIPDSVNYIGIQAFVSCTSLTSATIGTGVTSCGSSVFAYCTNLTHVTLKQGLTTLGDYMFDNSGVTKLIVPKSISNFSYLTFHGMEKSLKYLEIYVSTIPKDSFDGFKALETVILGEGVTKISDGSSSSGAFSYCTSLTTLSLPSTLTYIGSYAFYGCSALTEVYLPVRITRYDNSFPSSTTLVCPSDTTTASTLANAQQAYREPITFALPANTKTVKAEAFAGISFAEMIVLPEGCTSIGSLAFANMSNLHYVQLPDGTVVAPDAFLGSPVLEFIKY